MTKPEFIPDSYALFGAKGAASIERLSGLHDTIMRSVGADREPPPRSESAAQDNRRSRWDIGGDLWSKALGLDNMGLLIDLIGEYALHDAGVRRPHDVACETIFAAMQALAALGRETRAAISKIESELQTGERDAGQI